MKQIRAVKPEVCIRVRGDSGFCGEELMDWCEVARVDYLLGLARNKRLMANIKEELKKRGQQSRESVRAARNSKEFYYPRGRVGRGDDG